MHSQSSLHMELTHDVSCDGNSQASGISTHQLAGTDTDTVRGSSNEVIGLQSSAHTIGQVAATSPRKSIPAHWLPKSTGPNLATAQRAKERTQKKGSESGSPVEVKTLRGTRSSANLDRTHNKEGATYLTKEALAAVESGDTSPAASSCPSRPTGSPSKRLWNSPSGSPLRSSARQHPTLSIKVSPTKSMHLNAELASAGHSRALSSVATSTGRISFHTAEGSPVRSPASTEESFQSAAEDLEDMDVTSLNLLADCNDEQVLPGSSRSSALKATTEGKASSMKPKLAIRIPPSDEDSHNDHQSAVATASASSNFHMSNSSPTKASRIPRVGTTSKIAVSTNSATLQRAQSARSLTAKFKTIQERHREPQGFSLPDTSVASVQHMRTINSSAQHAAAPRAEPEPEQADAIALGPKTTDLRGRLDSTVTSDTQPSGVTSRVASDATVRPLASFRDPVLIDSAIVSCRMKSDNLGVHDFINHHEHVASAPASQAGDSTNSASPVPEKSDRMGSDLRATAPEFIPQPAAAPSPVIWETNARAPVSIYDLPGLPADTSELDRNGIPFFWYMYTAQFAYEQGFRNGRSKSPKKFKPKKQRSSLSSPVNAQQQTFSQVVPTTAVKSATPLPAAAKQRMTSAELMPPPPIPRRRGDPSRENSDPGLQFHESESAFSNHGSRQPFSEQFDLIAEQAALSNSTNNTPRHYTIDLSTVRNVGLPSGPRNMNPSTYYTVPRHGYRNHRHPGNGLYGGRGNAAGIPMDATAPFPNPVPPQGRPDQPEYTMGKEACGRVDIAFAAERIGGETCNACDPGH
ncbi:hypothetical protein BDW02DRAFT_566421 [Decorospora gaudefroyi]|uniref:Uncharacterized protein n=1 Tax=Decorospora gaudefroyi TaxID=184978 RepID=A0A6A5KMP2_9PLEO|nr:hypothetical protein BDW02DRAFT_566421 [Decorospora gaudefroyi]